MTDISKQPAVFIMTVLGLNDREDKIIMPLRNVSDSIRHQNCCDNFHSAKYMSSSPSYSLCFIILKKTLIRNCS